MKKWRGIDKEWAATEKDLCAVGVVLSQRWHDRVRELIKKISRKYPDIKFESIVSGMGGVNICGTVVDIDGRTIPLNEYFDCGCWGIGVIEQGAEWDKNHPGLFDIANELNEIWVKLEDEPYLEPICISKKEMKALLDNNSILLTYEIEVTQI